MTTSDFWRKWIIDSVIYFGRVMTAKYIGVVMTTKYILASGGATTNYTN